MDRIHFAEGRAQLLVEEGELHLRLTAEDRSVQFNLNRYVRAPADVGVLFKIIAFIKQLPASTR